MLYIVLAVLLWFVSPLLIEGHIRKKSDCKALIMLSRVLSILFVVLAIYRIFAM